MRMNISVPDRLAEDMRKMNLDVNWSAVAQEAFRQVVAGKSEKSTVLALRAENEKLRNLLCQVERLAAKAYSV